MSNMTRCSLLVCLPSSVFARLLVCSAAGALPLAERSEDSTTAYSTRCGDAVVLNTGGFLGVSTSSKHLISTISGYMAIWAVFLRSLRIERTNRDSILRIFHQNLQNHSNRPSPKPSGGKTDALSPFFVLPTFTFEVAMTSSMPPPSPSPSSPSSHQSPRGGFTLPLPLP